MFSTVYSMILFIWKKLFHLWEKNLWVFQNYSLLIVYDENYWRLPQKMYFIYFCNQLFYLETRFPYPPHSGIYIFGLLPQSSRSVLKSPKTVPNRCVMEFFWTSFFKLWRKVLKVVKTSMQTTAIVFMYISTSFSHLN